MLKSQPYGGSGGGAVVGQSRSALWTRRSRAVGRVMRTVLPVVLASWMTACATTGPVSGELGDLQTLGASCPNSPMATDVRQDVSGSQDDQQAGSAAFAAMRGQVEFAVACAAMTGSGHLRVELFATNASQTASVVDTDIRVTGATAIARQRRAVKDRLAEGLWNQIATAYPGARAGLPVSGSDILSQFRVAGEAASELEAALGTAWALNLVVLTDGFATDPPELMRAVTPAEGQALGERTRAAGPLGPVHAWRVSMLGIGRTGGAQASTEQIDAVKAFWTALLAGSADQVTVATDYATVGSDSLSPSGSASASTGAGR